MKYIKITLAAFSIVAASTLVSCSHEMMTAIMDDIYDGTSEKSTSYSSGRSYDSDGRTESYSESTTTYQTRYGEFTITESISEE